MALEEQVQEANEPSPEELLANAFNTSEDQVEETTEVEQVDPIVEKAKAKGWVERDGFKGEPEDYVDAAEFLRREKLFKKIHDINQDKKRLEKQIEATASYVAKLKEVEYDRALKTLRAEKAQALAEGDHDKVIEIDDKIMDTKAEAAKAKEEENKPDPEHVERVQKVFTDWRESNTWYDDNPEMRELADKAAASYAQANPNDTMDDLLEFVELKVKKKFPSQFTPSKPEQKKEVPLKAAAVAPAKGRAADGGTKGNLKTRAADLSSTQREIMRTFVAQGVMTEDAYIQSLIDIGELPR